MKRKNRERREVALLRSVKEDGPVIKWSEWQSNATHRIGSGGSGDAGRALCSGVRKRSSGFQRALLLASSRWRSRIARRAALRRMINREILNVRRYRTGSGAIRGQPGQRRLAGMFGQVFRQLVTTQKIEPVFHSEDSFVIPSQRWKLRRKNSSMDLFWAFQPEAREGAIVAIGIESALNTKIVLRAPLARDWRAKIFPACSPRTLLRRLMMGMRKIALLLGNWALKSRLGQRTNPRARRLALQW